MEKSHARNHHFISQVEQRLNAIDKSVKPENQRIYEFSILSRDPAKIKNDDASGVKIEKNLSRRDLYSLKQLEGGGQHNLESAFQRYEDDISIITNSLLEKLKNPKAVNFENELLRLYLLKLLNRLRNPYSIKMTLDSFSILRGVVPGSQELQSHFRSLDEADRPQVKRICDEFDISEEDYLAWLKTIYLLILQPLDHNLNMLETMLKSVIDNSNVSMDFYIFQYAGNHEDAGVLVCDRGLIEQTHFPGSQCHMFNIDTNTFAMIMSIDLKQQNIIPLVGRYADLDFKQSNIVPVHYKLNDMVMLKKYNELCVWLAHSKVYCANKNPFGVIVEQ